MKSRSVLVAVFVMCTAVLALLPLSHPAAAAPSEQWARWFIEVAFVNSKPVTTMTIEIGHDNPVGMPVIDIQKTYDVSCRETGALTLTSSGAEFDGNSYLTCNMPIFQEEVSQLSGGKVKINSTCECKLANGLADFTFSAPGGNPLFYMKGLQFSAPRQANSPDAYYSLTVAGETAVSEHFVPSKHMQHGGGEFVQSGQGYETLFQLDGATLAGSPAYISGLLEVPTDQNHFFIGFNPDTGEILRGKLGKLFIDPGCVGHGGI